MKRKAIWAVLTVLLAGLGACERAVPPVGPASGPIPILTTPTYAIPVTFTTTPNQSPTIPVTFVPSVTATIPVSFTATVYPSTTPTIGGGPITVTATTTPSAKFTLVKSESAASIAPGLPITYTLSYAQSGGPASNVVLTDTVPTGVTFDYSNPTFAGDAGVVFNRNGNLLTWAFSNPVDNLTGDISWVGTVGNVPCGTIINVAEMTASGMSPVLSNGVVCLVSCATSTPTVPVTFTATTIPSTPTDSPTIPVTFVPSVTATPISTIEPPPAPGCAGASEIGPNYYTNAISVPGGSFTFMSNGVGTSGVVYDIYFYSFTSGPSAVAGLYGDASGNNLLGSSNSFTVTAGWNKVPLATPVTVTGGYNAFFGIWSNSPITFGGGMATAASAYEVQSASSLPSVASGWTQYAGYWLAIYFEICPLPTNTPTATVSVASTATATPSLTATFPVTFTPVLTATIPVTFAPSPTSTTVLAPPTPACSGATIIGYNYNESPVTLAGGTVYYAQYPCGMTATLSTIHTSFVSSGISATVGIYADNSGVPGELLSSTGSFASIDGWNSVPLTTSVNVTKGNNYWLAIQISSACVFNGGYLGDSYFTQPGTSLPASLSVPSSPVTGRLGLYGDLCP